MRPQPLLLIRAHLDVDRRRRGLIERVQVDPGADQGPELRRTDETPHKSIERNAAVQQRDVRLETDRIGFSSEDSPVQ